MSTLSNQESTSSLNEIVNRLGGKNLGDGSIMVHCPAHNDGNPSLHVSISEDERKLLFNCFAGCSQEDVIYELKKLGLWSNGNKKRQNSNLLPGIFTELNDGKRYITHYEYRDKHGTLLGVVAKYLDSRSKSFIPYFKSNREKWIAGYSSERPLYGLHKIYQEPESPILVVEGEKAADAAQRLLGNKYVCITWPGGSNAVLKADWTPLYGRKVTIWPDADLSGRKAAKNIAKQLRTMGTQHVEIIELPASVEQSWDLADAEKEGWTQAQLLQVIQKDTLNEYGPVKRGFGLVQVGMLEAKPAEHIVQHILEKGSFSMIFGEPSSGKSFLGIDIGCCVATGQEFHGLSVQQGPVVYIAGEAQQGIARRLSSWSIHNNISISNAPFYLSTEPAALCDSESSQEVVSAIDQIPENRPPVLVVIDTLARNFGPGDENSTQDMSGFISAADKIREKYNCTVLLIHHTGHGDKSRARGAMALKGALDAEYHVQKSDSGLVIMTATKMKEANLPASMGFKLRQIKLGMRDDMDEEVTSAVLETAEYRKNSTSGKQARGKWQLKALQILQQLSQDNRERLEQGGYDPDEANISVDSWRNACLDAGIPRQRFYDTKKALEEAGHIRINNFHVELI